jgi:subtilisin family serine protease
MPNIFLDEHEPPSYAEIYRQIAITLRDGEFAALSEQLADRLNHAEIQYSELATIEDLRLVAIQVAPEEDVAAVLENLRSWKDIVQVAEQNRVLGPVQVVDDPLYRFQWALGRIGAEPAWQHVLATLDLAAPGVVVAVADSGIHVGHPDLAGHIWDDGFGRHGINLLTGSFNVIDTDGHGTQLAGTIGALSNNTLGIAAVEWPVRLMAVKFLDVRNPPTTLSGTIAIWWAVVQRAQVIVTAWGVGFPSWTLQVALWFAAAANVVIIAAAGNDGLDNDLLPTYPASFGGPPYNLTNVVSVMASDFVSARNAADFDDKASFSNYGKDRVHLAAPGVGVLSTDIYFGTPRWKPYSGTSAACAHVAYAAAILKALNPAWTPKNIRDHLIASVDKSPWLRCVAKGRLNLDRAVVGPFVVTSPLAGDVWQVNSNQSVTWTNRYQTSLAMNVHVLLKNGGVFTPLATNQPNTGTCTVVAPSTSVANAQVRIESAQGPGLYAMSGVFSVA